MPIGIFLFQLMLNSLSAKFRQNPSFIEKSDEKCSERWNNLWGQASSP
jgi:hypothetical protein